jgi:hypothetical protein
MAPRRGRKPTKRTNLVDDSASAEMSALFNSCRNAFLQLRLHEHGISYSALALIFRGEPVKPDQASIVEVVWQDYKAKHNYRSGDIIMADTDLPKALRESVIKSSQGGRYVRDDTASEEYATFW